MATEGPLSRQPDKLDYASPTQFRFVINQLPKVEYFTTSCNVPGISVDATELPTPFTPVPIVGDIAAFDDFTLSFIVATNCSKVMTFWAGVCVVPFLWFLFLPYLFSVH